MKLLMILFITFSLMSCDRVNDKQTETKKMTSNEIIEQGKKTEKDSALKEAKIDEGRCDIGVVLDAEESIDHISDTLIYSFLFTFDSQCKNHVEYGEFSNEVLFKLIHKHPERVAKNIVKEGINMDLILDELSNPVNDAIIVEDVIRSIEKSNVDAEIKNKIINALRNK